MKINTYKKTDLEENYLDFYYNKIDNETHAMLTYLCTFQKGVEGKSQNKKRMIYPHEIYYCEALEHRCYVYLKNSVWQIESNITEAAQRFRQNGFVRISKSMVVNIYQIQNVQSDFNMKMNLILKNGEKIVVNRGYKKEFLAYLEAGSKGVTKLFT